MSKTKQEKLAEYKRKTDKGYQEKLQVIKNNKEKLVAVLGERAFNRVIAGKLDAVEFKTIYMLALQ